MDYIGGRKINLSRFELSVLDMSADQIEELAAIKRDYVLAEIVCEALVHLANICDGPCHKSGFHYGRCDNELPASDPISLAVARVNAVKVPR